jgi:protein transport protein SEC24
MPIPLPLSSERLERHGLYLIEDGQTMFLWVGRDAVPQLVMDVFNLASYEALRGGKVNFVIRATQWPSLNITIPDDIASIGQSI